MEVLWVALVAWAGGVVAALAGWLESKSKFDPRKFGTSVVRSFIGGITIAYLFTYKEYLIPLDLLWAFLSGAGVDVIGNRVGGAIRKAGDTA